MTRVLRYVTLSTLLLSFFQPMLAEEVRLDVDFESYFDNREYSGIEGMNPRSGTDFAARLTPKLGWEFDEGSTLYIGVDAIQPFGGVVEDPYESLSPLLYYAYESAKWSVAMGIFERSRISMEGYSTAFFADDYLLYDNSISGVMARLMSDESYVEFVCDWESQPSATQRERFRLLSSGRRQWSKLYLGYNLSITHFAGQDAQWLGNVVDNILVNPCVGLRFEGMGFDVDAKLTYLQSLQRDRSYEDEWLTPGMGEFALKISKWGLTLDERCYIGGDLMPLYDGHIAEDGTVIEYGSTLYTGDPLFMTDGGFYNRASLGYQRSLCGDRLNIRAEFITHATEAGFGTQQQLSLSVKLDKILYRR